MAVITDEEYYRLPQLFHLADRERCLSQPDGTYCLGSFQLSALRNDQLFRTIKEYSTNPNNFNYTRLHRGLCVSTKCIREDSLNLEERFAQCVQNWVNNTYGLGARLDHLDYCETKDRSPGRAIDAVDITFTCIVVLLVLLNIVGTIYHFTNIKTKRNRYLVAWSLVTNFKQWTSKHESGPPQMSKLRPLHAIKALAMAVVVVLHTPLNYHRIYLRNPQFLEQANLNPLSTFFFNSPVGLQVFFMVTSFLIAYQQLLTADRSNGDGFKWKTMTSNYVKRIFRMSPVNAFVVGLSTTWWARLGRGPLWAPLVGADEADCRRTWWTHVLFINNLVYPNEVCLLHTWYIAADMQLYLLVIPLSLLLLRHSRQVIRFIISLCIISIIFNFIIAYCWNLRPILFLMKPELQRAVFAGEPSMPWMYMSPWGNMFSSLIGIWLAFLHRKMQKNKIKLENFNWLIWAFRAASLLIPVWVLAGFGALQLSSEPALALYTALDRPVFTLLCAVTLIGFLNKCDYLLWQFLWWRCWQPLSRMQLSVFLVHWAVILYRIAQWGSAVELSVLDTICDGVISLLLTYVVGAAVYLLVEAPALNFFRALLSPAAPILTPLVQPTTRHSSANENISFVQG